MKNIFITGSLAFDLIMDFQGKFADHIDPEKLHILNISFLVDSLKKERGGNSGNIAYTLSLIGISSSILSTAGNDFEPYANFLQNQNIDISNIKILDDESTATATIMTDKVDNQISAFYPGAMGQNINLSLKAVSGKPEFVIITPDVPEAMLKFAIECKELSIPYLFDPGMQLPRLTDEQLLAGIDGCEILIGNDYEMGIIQKRLKLSDEDLLQKTKVLITTLGEKGSIIQTTNEKLEIGIAKPEIVNDPTGAGDAYRSGFIAGFLKDLDLKTCGQMGALASCYAIEKYGTTNHSFSLDEFKNRYTKNFGKELHLEEEL